MHLKNRDKQLIVDTLKLEIPELQALYLFGSQNDGTASMQSDVDIAYLSKSVLTSVERWELSNKLASLLSINVDLIELSQTNTIFRYQILSTAERIYGEGYEVESFETLAYSFYLRFQEERKPIVDAIMKNRSVFGKSMPDVVLNKIQTIERCLKRIREEYVGSEDIFEKNHTKQDSVILNLERASQASIDIATHIIKTKSLGLPNTSRELFVCF